MTGHDHPSYRKEVCERVCYNDKKLQSSNIQCDAAQNPLPENRAVCQAKAVLLGMEQSPATFSDNVARI